MWWVNSLNHNLFAPTMLILVVIANHQKKRGMWFGFWVNGFVVCLDFSGKRGGNRKQRRIYYVGLHLEAFAETFSCRSLEANGQRKLWPLVGWSVFRCVRWVTQLFAFLCSEIMTYMRYSLPFMSTLHWTFCHYKTTTDGSGHRLTDTDITGTSVAIIRGF